MAEVYRATVTGPGGFAKPAVIKRVKPQYAENEVYVRMFIDEAKISASLDHPNLVSVFDFGEADGHYYLAMEYIEGMDVQVAHVRHNQRYGVPIPWGASVLIVRDVLRGLDYAHHKTDASGRPLQLIHRDVNLVNVMIRRDGTVKVLDFGCAKAAKGFRSSETVAGVIKGKLGYMSPEQTEDRPLDARTDVFSAGIVLHELLTGRRLFFGDTEVDVIMAVRQRPIPDPRKYQPEVPEPVVQVLLRGLSRDLDGRYASAGAMADALDEVVSTCRVPPTAVRQLIDRLVGQDRSVMSDAFTLQVRKLTLMSWQGELSDVAPAEVPSRVSGVVTSAPHTDPFGESTIVTTNPRWLIEEAALQDPGSIVDGIPLAEDPPVSLSDRMTELLEVSAPAVGLTDEPTMLLGVSEAPPAGPPAPAPAPAPAAAPPPPLASRRRSLPRWLLLLAAIAALGSGLILLLVRLRS
jgi:serine/threonine-protein kinase